MAVRDPTRTYRLLATTADDKLPSDLIEALTSIRSEDISCAVKNSKVQAKTCM
jgi:hypothetical protein